jgi:hypothetical protein
MDQSRKLDIPLDRTTRTLYIIRNGSLLESGNDKQTKERLFKSTIPTPNIIPKVDLGALTQIKLDLPLKLLPPHANKFPQTHPMGTRNITYCY